MITLYDDAISGNGYKVRLLFALAGVPYRLVELDILKGETRTPEFLARNPNGRIPTVELEDGRHLWESGAVLYHFSQGTAYWPDAPFDRADTLRWMFFEQYSHEPYIAVARFLMHLPEPPAPELLAEKQEKGRAALAVMEGHLAAQSNLGFMYDNGLGVPQDLVQAHQWLNLAAAQGNKLGMKNRDIVAKRMTPADISKAQILAREWLAKHPKK